MLALLSLVSLAASQHLPCGQIKNLYRKAACCGAPEKETSIGGCSTCGDAQALYKAKGCCGRPDQAVDTSGCSAEGAGEEVCRDFARWDGQPWTDGELYSCNAYCGSMWCTEDSYNTSRVDDFTAEYSYGSLGQGLFDPLNEIRLAPQMPFNNYTVGEEPLSMSDHWLSGYNWYTATGVPLNSHEVLDFYGVNASDLKLEHLQPDNIVTEQEKSACYAAGRLIGVQTFFQNDINQMCHLWPLELAAAMSDQFAGGSGGGYGYGGLNPNLTPVGKYVASQGTSCAYNGTHVYYPGDPTADFQCYIPFNAYFLYGANIAGAWNGVMQRFNLPADAACCCCGGGTRKNKAGQRMQFKVPASYYPVQATMTEPNMSALEQSLAANGPVTADYSDSFISSLYPEAVRADLIQQSDTKGLNYTFPNSTHPSSTPKDYPYAPGALLNGGTCEDYQLDKHIKRYSLAFHGLGTGWVGWAGYTCRFWHSNNACNPDGTQAADMQAQFGPIAFYFNGVFHDHVVEAWPRPLNNHTPIDVTRVTADPNKVCCTCGGGLKSDGSGPAVVVDPFSVSYYLKT